jgi:malonyl CoA-acyl carrier protein transacylase
VQGYAIAKLVAEHALLRLAKSMPGVFDLAIIRLGQVCGDTLKGAWAANEAVPMMMSSLPTLRVLPMHVPEVGWIPSDTCAMTLRDFLLIPPSSAREPLILHIANPFVSEWPVVAHDIARIANINDFALVSMHDYVQTVKRHLVMGTPNIPVARLLPFFESMAGNTASQRFTPLEIRVSRQYSAALDSCAPIGGRLLEAIVRHATRHAASGTPGHIFVFGPVATRADAMLPRSDTMARVMTAATAAGLLAAELNDDELLSRQLHTIATQLDAVEEMRARGIVPAVVTGYCFGEYAAAVAAGMLTLDTAVEVLVLRARVVRGVDGALLNAFTTFDTVRRLIAPLPSPPSIAIIAGPTHVVLSGTTEQIRAAEHVLGMAGVKSIFAASQAPFHSPLMDAPSRALQLPSRLSSSQGPPVSRFVSGIAGVDLPRITPSYWKRHMCVLFDFLKVMEVARATLPGAQIVDIGPGDMVSRMIARFGGSWARSSICSPENATRVTHSIPTPPPSPPLPLRDITSAPHKYTSEEAGNNSRSDILSLLAETLGVAPSEKLLERSLHALGMQSLDFVRFSERLSAISGIRVSMSAYVSDEPLSSILHSAHVVV